MFKYVSLSEKGQTHALPISAMVKILEWLDAEQEKHDESLLNSHLVVWLESKSKPSMLTIVAPDGVRSEAKRLDPQEFMLVPLGHAFEMAFEGLEIQPYWTSPNGAVFEGKPEPLSIPSDAKPGYEKAAQWLLEGETGMSSLAMCYTFFPQLKDVKEEYQNHPLDPADLRRCVLFLDAVPEARSRLNELSDISPTWKALVEHWTDLESILKDELANDPEGHPTYEKMNEVFATIPKSSSPKM